MLKTLDIVKAFGLAIGVMALNVAISYVAVAVYAYLIEPGHDNAFYEAAAQDIAPWSSVIAGVFLFFGVSYLFAKRRPERNAVYFAVAIWAGYLLVEFVILAGVGTLGSALGLVSFSLVTKLIAAVGGAIRAQRR